MAIAILPAVIGTVYDELYDWAIDFSYASYSQHADSIVGGAATQCITAVAADDMIVTSCLCHAPEGLAKCIALGVDGTKAYTTAA